MKKNRKKLSDSSRNDLKKFLEIREVQKGKKCSTCIFFYKINQLCGYHTIKVKDNEYCKHYNTYNKIKVYKGGLGTPK